MTLIVHSWGAYASYPREKYAWRNEDYTVNRVVKALKGAAFKGYANVVDANGIARRVEQGSKSSATAIFAAWAARRVQELALAPTVFVPVPSSTCTAFGAPSAPQSMANALVTKIGKGATLGPWLRFETVMEPSHSGGSRKQSVIEQALRINDSAVQPGATVTLVDDVKTTGAHLRACASALRDVGCHVHTVLVAASTVWDRVDDPFKLPPEDLEAVPFDVLGFDIF